MEKTVAAWVGNGTSDKLFWGVLTSGLLLFAIVTIPPGARQCRALRRNVDEARRVSAQTRQTEQLLRDRERSLQSDPFYNEAVLRSRMKYTRSGEKEIVAPSTIDRRLLVDMPRIPDYVPEPLPSPGIADRVTAWSLLAASALLISAAFIFFDHPAVSARPR